MSTTKRYRVVDRPLSGIVGQDCGTFALADLPPRIRAYVEASPDAGTWRLPALSGGDNGAELDDLQTVITAESPDVKIR